MAGWTRGAGGRPGKRADAPGQIRDIRTAAFAPASLQISSLARNERFWIFDFGLESEDLHLVVVLRKAAIAPRECHVGFAADLDDSALAGKAEIADAEARHCVAIPNREHLEGLSLHFRSP